MKQTNWEQVRIQAAIAAMQGYCSAEVILAKFPESKVAAYAVMQADALIVELKKEK